jgi:uncharacterized protein YndB with AHSA1/START domain
METVNAVKRSNSVYSPETRELTIMRTFNAPRELVWKVWTEPEHLAKWWGPNGFTNPVCEADVRPGGAMRIHMYHPEYPEHWVKGVFREVVKPELLVFTNNAHIGEQNPPSIESITTVTLEEHNGGTKLTMHTVVTNIKPEMAAALAGMEEGWNQSLDRFTEEVASTSQADTADREIVTTRVFNAPRELVWKVWTEPEHIAKWWGPNGFTNTIHKMDVRVGGEWRYIMHGPDGTDYPTKVLYAKIVERERLEYYLGSDNNENDPVEFYSIVTFEAQGNKTKVTMRGIFKTAEEKAFVAEKSHAVEGAQQTFDRMAEYLAKVSGAGVK